MIYRCTSWMPPLFSPLPSLRIVDGLSASGPNGWCLWQQDWCAWHGRSHEVERSWLGDARGGQHAASARALGHLLRPRGVRELCWNSRVPGVSLVVGGGCMFLWCWAWGNSKRQGVSDLGSVCQKCQDVRMITLYNINALTTLRTINPRQSSPLIPYSAVFLLAPGVAFGDLWWLGQQMVGWRVANQRLLHCWTTLCYYQGRTTIRTCYRTDEGDHIWRGFSVHQWYGHLAWRLDG